MSLRKEIVFDVQEIGLGQVKARIDGLSTAFGEVNAKVNLNSIALKSNLSRLKSLSSSQKGQTALFNEYNKILNQVTQTTSRNRAQTDRLIETYRTTGELTNKQITEAKRLVESNYEIAQSEAVTMMATDRRYAGQIQANQAVRSATSGGRILAQVLEEVTGETHAAAGGTAQFSGALGGMSGNMAGSSKSLASSNQLLFSFSDLVQDSTQFSQGFATGMRAIGNNIGFTMELFASVNNHVKEFNRVNKEAIAVGKEQAKTVKGQIGQSLKGFGGALLGVNAAVMLVTVGLQIMEKRLNKIREQGKESAKVFSEVAKTFSQVSGAGDLSDSLGIASLGREVEFLSDQFEKLNDPFAQFLKQGNKDIPIVREFAKLSINFRAAFISGDENTKSLVRQMAAYEELSVEVEKLQMKQKIYTQFLADDMNVGLRRSTQLLGQIAEKNTLYGATIQETSALSKQNQQQIASSIASISLHADLTETDIIALNDLAKAYDELARRRKVATDFQRQENDLLNERASLMVQETKQNAERGTSRQKLDAAIQQNRLSAALEIEQIRREKEDREFELQRLKDLKLISDEVYKDRIRQVNDLAVQQTNAAHQTQAFEDRQAELNKVVSDAGVVQSLAQTTALLGNVFGASKDMQIAMAVIDGGAAIVKTFAQLGFPAGIPAALAVAAQTAQTIKQMKDTKPGDTAPIGGSGGSSAPSFGTTITPVQNQPSFASPSFIPSASSEAGSRQTVVEIHADRKQLYSMVRQGEEEYRQRQA